MVPDNVFRRPTLIPACLVVALLLGFGNAVNDLFDLEIDSRAKPSRPLPSGRLRPKEGLGLAIGLLVTSFVLSLWYLPLPLTGVAVLMALLAVAYSWRLKGTALLGNLIVAFECAASLPFGALAVSRVLNTRLLTSTTLIFLGVLIVEVAKAVQDREGDLLFGVKTLAARWTMATQHIVLGGLLLVYLFLWMLAILHHPPTSYVSASLIIVPAIPLAWYVAISWEITAATIGSYIRLSKTLWILALLGLLSLR
ncbi:MAG: UbiA family prenyltransferase [Actinomycetota bacterium]|nr:UbiA family prenyltransferase [Actinomycetota bacterium]